MVEQVAEAAKAAPKPVKMKLEPGDVVFIQGEVTQELYLLHTGKLEILVCDLDPLPKTKDDMVRKSIRVAIMDKPGPFGELAAILKTPRTASVVCLEKAEVTKFAAVDGAFQAMVHGNPKVGVDFSLTLLKRYTSTLQEITVANTILKNLQRLQDNAAFLFAHSAAQILEKKGFGSGIKFDEKTSKSFLRGQRIYQILAKTENLPKKFSFAVLEKDYSKLIGVAYGGKTVKASEIRESDFYRRLVMDKDAHFKSMIVTDPSLIVFIVQRLAAKLPPGNALMLNYKERVDATIESFIGRAGSILEDAAMLVEGVPVDKTEFKASREALDGLVSHIVRHSRPLVENYIELWGSEPQKISAYYKKIVKDLSKQEEEERKKAEREAAQQEAMRASGAAVVQLKDVLKSYFSFYTAPDDVKTRLSKALEVYKALEDKMEATGDGRKVKKELIDSYWVFYKHAIGQYMESPDTATPTSRLILRYGLLDESLIKPEDANDIMHMPMAQTSEEIPIYYADEWLRRFFENKEGPSNSEMGESFQEVQKRGDDLSAYEDPAFGLMNYELDHLISGAVRMCAGGAAYNFPVLDEHFCGSGLEKKALTKAKLEKAVLELRKIDYGIFMRDVKVVVEGKAYFLPKEVMPNFIIMPSFGAQAICWQELDGASKETRARVVIPLFLQGDVNEILLDVFAKYRWNLARTIAGYNWANPTEGGLTGEYFDYMSFYKKNNELTMEDKEKLAEFDKKYTGIGEKFAADYITWMTQERDGVQKMNKVARGIFFKNAPFARRIREKLQGAPAFEKVIYKDDNMRKKKVHEYDLMIKAFEKDGVEVPPQLLEAIEYQKL